MMRDLYNALPLPDDRPIMSVCVVEELSGCPPNYTPVSKTHDQDIDADLYKDGFFRRVTRYLCHSKTEGYMGYVVEHLAIVNDRDARPVGYTIVEQTFDTNQKAFKKKQLCYKQVPRNMATQTITDIIILSRSKVAPEGFSLVGEMNGLCVCIKPGPAPTPQYKPPAQASSPLLYGLVFLLPHLVVFTCFTQLKSPHFKSDTGEFLNSKVIIYSILLLHVLVSHETKICIVSQCVLICGKVHIIVLSNSQKHKLFRLYTVIWKCDLNLNYYENYELLVYDEDLV